MFDAFVRIFLLLFLKILFHIQIALGLLFPKHILILPLDKSLLPQIWFPWYIFWDFWNILLCILGRVNRGRVCCCGLCCNWQVTCDIWHVIGDRWQATVNRWQVTGVMSDVTGDKWHVTCAMCHIFKVPLSAPEFLKCLMPLCWYFYFHFFTYFYIFR